MKVLVINAGSSSLKYQLIEMDNEEVVAKGLCERIGIDGHISHKTAAGWKTEYDVPFPTHKEAFEELVKLLTEGENKVVSDIKEIKAIGHRVLHGSEKYKASTIITDEVIEDIGVKFKGLPGSFRKRNPHGCRFRYLLPSDHAAEGLYVRYSL